EGVVRTMGDEELEGRAVAACGALDEVRGRRGGDGCGRGDRGHSALGMPVQREPGGQATHTRIDAAIRPRVGSNLRGSATKPIVRSYRVASVRRQIDPTCQPGPASTVQGPNADAWRM